MIIQLGHKIKELRLSKGVTQDAFAAELGVSAQAVSKWENDSTFPDITLLPQISIYFGVSIDELFQLTTEAHFERIEEMVVTENMLSDFSFSYSEKFLKEQLLAPKYKGRALTLLAELYNKRASGYREIACQYAKEGLLLEPEKKDNHSALRESCNGAIADWNVRNNHSLIQYYYEFMEKHPTYWRGYLWLLNNLLADNRLDEAEEIVRRLETFQVAGRALSYKTLIAIQKGDMEEAMKYHNEMLELYPEDWITYIMAAEHMVQMGNYEEAIEYYYQATNTQASPKFTDSYQAISHIYEIQGKHKLAAEAKKKVMDLLASDWNITVGTMIDDLHNEIKDLEKK